LNSNKCYTKRKHQAAGKWRSMNTAAD